MGAPSAHSCGGAEERKRCDGGAGATFTHAVAPVGAPSAAAAGLYGELRGYRKSCCCADLRRFRIDQVTRRDSVASFGSQSRSGTGIADGVVCDYRCNLLKSVAR